MDPSTVVNNNIPSLVVQDDIPDPTANVPGLSIRPQDPEGEDRPATGQRVRKLIKGIDLTELRAATLPDNAYWLYALPVIGWIALACLKIHCYRKNAQAESELQERDYASAGHEDRVEILKTVIDKAGPNKWQYQLELAREYLLNGKPDEAKKALDAAAVQRQAPRQTGWYNVKGLNLIHFNSPEGDWWKDPKNVITITYRTATEALLHTAVAALEGRFVDAYHAGNEVIFYDKSPELQMKIRQLQRQLVVAMEEIIKAASVDRTAPIDANMRTIVIAEGHYYGGS